MEKFKQPTNDEMKIALYLANKKVNGEPLKQNGWDTYNIYFDYADPNKLGEIVIKKWKVKVIVLLLKLWIAVCYNADEKRFK